MDESLQQRIEEAVREEITIVPYNPEWPSLFEKEANFLRRVLPKSLIKRIEHFGSTAILGMSSKPVIDILVEVSSVEETKKQIVPLLELEGYEYFWRPMTDDDQSPHYAWFIKRDGRGTRTHHIHIVEGHSELWDRLFFRDYLREFPEEAKRYEELKALYSEKYPNDRVAYTKSKTEYVVSTTKKAKQYYRILKGDRNRASR